MGMGYSCVFVSPKIRACNTGSKTKNKVGPWHTTTVCEVGPIDGAGSRKALQ